MNHNAIAPITKKCRHVSGGTSPVHSHASRLFLLLVLALLICNTTAGLASRLTGCLALAASAVLCTVAQVARFKRFDMLHTVDPPFEIYYN